MADRTPSTTSFKLPDDVHVLAHLRDQLGDYLSTLERNTDSIREWLEQQQNNIIVGHHRLVRAIEMDGDEKKAIKILSELGETAGFILNLQDFGALAQNRFGKNSAFEKALSAAPRGFPADILEELPKIRVPKAGDTVEAIGLNTRVEIPPVPQEEKKGFWSQLGGMFKSEDPEEEARRKEEAIKRHWRQVRGELISLQSDRHYYIDSFMDWVGENLEPAEPAAPSATIMQQYQSPQYVIDLAQRDYDEVNKERAARLNTQALQYSAIARKLDTQDIQGFIQLLPTLFPRSETPESKRSKELLLTDFGVASFAELALTHVKKDEDRIALLSAALSHEPKFQIAGLKSDAQIFERVLGEVLKPEPLNADALDITLKRLMKGRERDAAMTLFPLDNAKKTPFYRIGQRFANDLPQAGRTMQKLLSGIGAKESDVADKIVKFAGATEKQDPAAQLAILRSVAAQDQGQAFMAMWELTFPGKSLTESLVAGGAAPKMLAQLAEAAIDAGMNNEWRLETNAYQADLRRTIGFLKEQIIGSLATDETFALSPARKFIAHAFLNGGLDVLRPELTKAGGLLEQVVSSGKIDNKQKLEWVAALIEPYSSDIVRANILHEAADRAQDKTAARILSGLEAAFSGSAVRIDDDRVLTNLSRIANIWYNPEPKTLQFTVGGVGHLLQEKVSQHMADETLALIQRKGGFEPEYDGLIKPENIDRIVSTPNGTKLSWHRHTTDFNGTEAQAAAFHARPDFVHEDDPKTGLTFSINQKAVLLIQPLEDGTHLLVDKYGTAQLLEGKLRIDPASGLTDLGGGTWFNPQNASVISLDMAKNTLEFRAESKDFDDFLESGDNGDYLYAVALPDENVREKIAAAIAGDTGFVVPVASSDLLALNMRALGYLQYDNEDPENAGFACHKYGPTRKPGFVHTDDAEFAEAIFTGLQNAKDLVVVENLIAHKSMIEDAYYNAEKGTFYMLVGQDVLEAQTDDKTAYAALKKLSEEKGFETVGVNYVNSPAPNSVGHAEAPADVVNLARATLISYSAAQEHTLLHTDQDKYHINLDRAQARELTGRLEKDGQAAAQKATEKMPWVRDLSKMLKFAPAFEVVAKPALTDSAPLYLLSQVMNGKNETRKMPDVDKDFSVAAAAVKTGEKITYPRSRQPYEAFPRKSSSFESSIKYNPRF